jgi:hypothetical protein
MEFRCIIVGNRDLNDFVGSAHREETMCRILGEKKFTLKPEPMCG